jgi:hypothetical protein
MLCSITWAKGCYCLQAYTFSLALSTFHSSPSDKNLLLESLNLILVLLPLLLESMVRLLLLLPPQLLHLLHLLLHLHLSQEYK